MTLPRVVSLVPSATEMLCALGGESMLVGRSHECDFPQSITHVPALTRQRVSAVGSAAIDRQVREALGGGGDASLYMLDAALLAQLRPNLILTQDVCQVCSIDMSAVREAAGRLDPQPQIISLNPQTIDDVFDGMVRVAEAAELSQDRIVSLRERSWQAREHVNAYTPGERVAVVEWLEPLFVAGRWTPQLVEQAGGEHPLNAPGAKSRQVSAEEFVASQPERLIICPCGFTIDQTQREMHLLTSQPWWRSLTAVQRGAVMLVDGSQMFSRPGPRLIDALEWLVGWLNERPGLMKKSFPAVAFDGA